MKATDTQIATDSLKSFLGNQGDINRDKSAGLTFVDKKITDDQLMAAFQNNWIAKKIVLLVPFDSTRKWRTWAGEKGPEVAIEERRLNVRGKIFEASWKARLFGGAAVIIGIDGEDVTEELNPETVGKGDLKYLTVLSRRELHAEELERDVESPYYNQPKYYKVSSGDAASGMQDVKIHPSRMVIFNGDEKPDVSLSDGLSFGWGSSILKVVHDTIVHAGGVYAGIATLVLEANIDVIAVPDLMKRMGSEKEKSSLLSRFTFAAAAKGITGMLLRDTKEEYSRNSANFSNIDHVLEKFSIQCAAADGIPATVFLSQSPAGLQATGESDMQIHQDRIQANQAVTYDPAMHLLNECIIRSALDDVPEDIQFEWNPLRQLSEKDQAEIDKIHSDAVSKMDIEIMPQESVYAWMKKRGFFEDTKIDTFENYKTAVAENERV